MDTEGHEDVENNMVANSMEEMKESVIEPWFVLRALRTLHVQALCFPLSCRDIHPTA